MQLESAFAAHEVLDGAGACLGAWRDEGPLGGLPGQQELDVALLFGAGCDAGAAEEDSSSNGCSLGAARAPRKG